jgi:hypothetical protein
VNDPRTSAPEDLVTQIVIPLVPQLAGVHSGTS